MSKIIYNKLKVILVISIYLITLQGFKQEENFNDDYKILDYIIKRNKGTEILNKSRNNDYVIDKIRRLKEADINSEFKVLDSLKQIYGISNDKILNKELFNKVNYSFLINQLDTETHWIKNNIKNQVISLTDKNVKKNWLYVSKPIYSENRKFALTQVALKNKSYILVLYRNDISDEWKEYKIICVQFG
ncbi:MAG: hypothetical protein O9282_00380 [Flavobacterium sp.]|jgi:hypothetical protein|uniref:hypothetical protein n=1 Tax=Flavobacterium sp. TaxID=239 RepID=UPI0022BECDBA|nr:hypothetical protein [Flavobacterium sp.]MCZ8329745.1 hypothetical protein [Flavobacterium sp.]